MQAFWTGNESFLGESLWIGQLGHLSLLSSFIFALLAAFAFYKAHQSDDDSWKQLGRKAFMAHGFSVIASFALMFYMIINHHFEYYYAWRHSSLDLPLRYIISCFWEGQEGSFLLWEFWHVVLGIVLIYTAKEWENRVMVPVSLVQAALATMVLGIYVFGYKIGSNPFMLLRWEMGDAPIFQQANYLEFVTDGNGLNLLLQNYWMVIHPPVLFLGFASTLIPFAYAVSALFSQDHKNWIQPALPWALFSGGFLGMGILMGGAWAYEALSFGGFWAWDPVENASLVPWLILVAAIHLMVVYKHTKHGLKVAYLFSILTFILILYSTFLTRSGILGDTSVHSFTDLGMTGQLVIYLAMFSLPPLVLLLWRWRLIPSPKKEEPFMSREFWMLVGALVLLFAGIQITYTTSIPVWNTLFGTDIAPPVDLVGHYNKVQIWIAVIIAILSAALQYFNYRNEQWQRHLKHLLGSLIAAVVLSVGLGYFYDLTRIDHWALLITGMYVITANLLYIHSKWRWQLPKTGASLAHIGFGLMLVGILISQGQQEVISINLEGIDYGSEFSDDDKRENQLLLADRSVRMGNYQITYKGTIEGTPQEPGTKYRVFYEHLDANGEVMDTFSLYPHAILSKDMGLTPNPDTKHYWSKDVFTHVTSIPDNSDLMDTSYRKTIALGDTFFTSQYIVALEAFEPFVANDTDKERYDIAVYAKFKALGFDNAVSEVKPFYGIVGQSSRSQAATHKDGKLTLEVLKIDPTNNGVEVMVSEREDASDFIIMKAIVFPQINLLWLGCFVMIFGFLLSSYQRRQEQKRRA